MKLVIDMGLSIEWVIELARHGWEATHWSSVGDPKADDATIMAWARANDQVVFTHDLDFGTALALTNATAPSVLQIRGQAVLPDDIGEIVAAALHQHEAVLTAGAIVVVDQRKARSRVLPFNPDDEAT